MSLQLPADAVPAAFAAALGEDTARLAAALGDERCAAIEDVFLQEPARREELARLLCQSRFVFRECERHPDLLPELLQSGDLLRDYGPDEYLQHARAALAGTTAEAAVMSALRTLRRREMLRILWREQCALADFRTTTADLSALASAAIEVALETAHTELAQKHGEPIGESSATPQRMVVIGMGKLGAHELNLSSDIDLIFAYPEQGETAGERSLSNREFFVRVGQRLIKSLDAVTRDGFVFRVDMRLRPYGDSGALALNFDAMELYYQDQGRDWERYAMIKARVVAGDRAAGEALLTTLRPFVYRRYIDFSAIESLRQMKSMISREVARRGQAGDVKLDAGGIREIEFIVQSFQLIRGGREPRLQERSLLAVLHTLGDLGQLPVKAVLELREAYLFLRATEHALQARDDAQTQALPQQPEERERLAFAMGFADWEAFHAVLAGHRARVSAQFAAVVSEPAAESAAADASGPWQALWRMEQSSEDLEKALAAAGFEDPAGTRRRLAELHDGNRVRALQAAGRERLDRFMPLFLAAAARSQKPSLLLLRAMPLVEAVLRRSAYLVLLTENPAALAQVVTLCTASPWIAQELANHPVLLDELIDPRSLQVLPQRERLAAELREHMLRVPQDDLEAHMEALRYFKLAHGLRCAASEVTGALPLMKVSDYLSFLAEAILGHVLRFCWQDLLAKHGTPQKREGEPCDPDFVIVAYGKLGGIELGHGSDLDLVFLHDAATDLCTDGPRPLENTLFFTRLGQRIIHVLSTFTGLGPLYEVDMRLRPSGAKGLLVSSFTAFEDYQAREAWTWEHQALVRARPVAGCPRLGARFEALRRAVLARPRDPEKLRADVSDMRTKMRMHLLKPDTAAPDSPRFHLKQSPGGIVDIEFLVQYAALAWSGAHPEVSVYTDNIRILEALGACGLLSQADAEFLTAAYKAYRTETHRLALLREDEVVDAARFREARTAVLGLWGRLLGR
jgi:glutamate-ammonia-ligase adenylyltransferase